MCYLIGYSGPEDKCEAMWDDDYLGRIQNIPVPLLLPTMNLT